MSQQNTIQITPRQPNELRINPHIVVSATDDWSVESYLQMCQLQLKKTADKFEIFHPDLTPLADYNPQIVMMRYNCKACRFWYDDISHYLKRKGWMVTVRHIEMEMYGEVKNLASTPFYAGKPIDNLTPSKPYEHSYFNFDMMRDIVRYYSDSNGYIRGSLGQSGTHKGRFGFAIRITNPRYFEAGGSENPNCSSIRKVPRWLYAPIAQFLICGTIYDNRPMIGYSTNI